MRLSNILEDGDDLQRYRLVENDEIEKKGKEKTKLKSQT